MSDSQPSSISLNEWLTAIIVAVDEDNRDGHARCNSCRTFHLLQDAPAQVRDHTQLILRDFIAAGDGPLSQLRSNEVGRHFRVQETPGSTNLFVGRMIVPSGPWPGHYGLEAAAFSARRAVMPDWFPQVEATSSLHLAYDIGLSAGFERGHGSVLFPELLSATERAQKQGFGVAFIDRLTVLYEQYVGRTTLGQLAPQGETASTNTANELREIAFLAHEWGHFSSLTPLGLGLDLVMVHKRLAAVIGELQADLAALCMLIDSSHLAAPRAAYVLTLDRIGREAWLPRAERQVGSIASRQLIAILRRRGCLTIHQDKLALELLPYRDVLTDELLIVQRLEAEMMGGDAASALQYLSSDGWSVQADRYHVDTDDQVVAQLKQHSQQAQRKIS